MKLQITNGAKQYLTLAEMPNVREIIADCKADEMSVKDYAKIAADFVFKQGYCSVFEATAEIVRHEGYEYNETNKNIDVWIEFKAYNEYVNRFAICGIYLSDIWQIGNDDVENAIKQRMFIRRYVLE